MATKEPEDLSMAVEESKTRDLYNALRTGEHGVSIESLAQALYFLQHAEFTLFDVKDAFRSSAGASERFLGYREFQITLSKLSRVKHYGNCGGMEESLSEADSPTQRRRLTESELIGLLVTQMLHSHRHQQLDVLRCQLVRRSSLDTLEQYLPELVQSFQLYGKQNCLATNSAPSMQSTITFDGFVDFLNAYFEYEDFFSCDDLTRMAKEVVVGFTTPLAKAESKQIDHSNEEMNFAQFMELFCRVASAFHHKLLIREGAQLRRAVESCRLEFSIEMLMDHMRITLVPREDLVPHPNLETPTYSDSAANSIHSPRDEASSISTVVQDIRDALRLESSADLGTKRPMKHRQLSKRLSSTSVEPILHSISQPLPKVESQKPPPQVSMIREVIMPPQMPADVVQMLERALKFQNMGQHNMALSALDSCRLRYQQQCISNEDSVSNSQDISHTETQLFFVLHAASILDSAHRDSLALTKYHEALKLARDLPKLHMGRVLVKSCMGVALFYVGERELSQQCHQLVLDARMPTRHSKGDLRDKLTAVKSNSIDRLALVDTATAMNNLACCLSQEQASAKALDSAYLHFKHARQIYEDAFGPAHPRVEVITRNLDHVRACQSTVVSDATRALARGEYLHVIPGSRFQIQALEQVKKNSGTKNSKAEGKKKKKGAK